MNERQNEQQPHKSAATHEEAKTGNQEHTSKEGTDATALVAGRSAATEQHASLTDKTNVTGGEFDGQTA